MPATTPTYDGSGQAIHPSVIDMHLRVGGNWNGFRYWMAMTPHRGWDARLENPSILASHDGFYWQVPPGLTNPLYPWPGQATNDADWYSADVDMEWDPDAGRMILIWREGKLGDLAMQKFWMATSTTGTEWTPRVEIFNPGGLMSPGIVRVAPDDWRIWATTSGGAVHRYTATTAEGPWVGPLDDTNLTRFWHIDVTLHGGAFYAVGHTTGSPRHIIGARSSDGITWTQRATPIMEAGGGAWDADFYRPTIQPHENGTHFRCWYTGVGDQGIRIGYTQIPISEWH